MAFLTLSATLLDGQCEREVDGNEPRTKAFSTKENVEALRSVFVRFNITCFGTPLVMPQSGIIVQGTIGNNLSQPNRKNLARLA